MKRHFDPIKDKCGDIIEYIMSSPNIPSDDDLQFRIRLSVEEVVENVVSYAYEDGSGWLEAGVDLENDGLILAIEIKDAGIPFNPLDAGEPDLDAPLEERKIGGLGIFLTKKMMDSVDYRYADGCNILTMKKKLN